MLLLLAAGFSQVLSCTCVRSYLGKYIRLYVDIYTQTMSRAIEVGKVEHSAAELSPQFLSRVSMLFCCQVAATGKHFPCQQFCSHSIAGPFEPGKSCEPHPPMLP